MRPEPEGYHGHGYRLGFRVSTVNLLLIRSDYGQGKFRVLTANKNYASRVTGTLHRCIAYQ